MVAGVPGRQSGAMTEHPTSEGSDTGPRVTAAEARDLSRLRRSSTDRHVAGVAGGLGRHLDIDPVILRVAFVVLTLTGGAGLLFYLACWLVVPSDDDGATLDLDGRSRNIALWAVTLLAGLVTLGALLGDPFPWDHFWVPLPLVVIAVVLWLFLGRNRDRDQPGHHGPPPAGHALAEEVHSSSEMQRDMGAWHVAGDPQQGYRWRRNPRKRGPRLFWPTMALAALGVGILGMVDVSGVGVPDSSYPALVVATCAVMLLVGAFWGRAGGLILVGLLATGATALTAAADHWDDREHVTPTTAAALDESYRMEAGDLVVDLADIEDLEALDGRALDIEGGLGRIEVVVPDEGLDVEATAAVGGPGHVVVFGSEHGGIDSRRTGTHDGGDDVPTLTLGTELGVGEIVVRTESDTRWSDRFEQRRNR
jgi:phage shock protein PspC (stress-responsive transcriptional regulator)